jgi:hypothetical protein
VSLVATERETATSPIERAIQTLGNAGMVAFGGVGIAGSVLPETAAFDTLAGAGPAARAALERLLDTATPAGKVYAATALDRIDPDAGRAAWRRLRDDQSEITTASGCLIDRNTVGQYAAEQLDGNRFEQR